MHAGTCNWKLACPKPRGCTSPFILLILIPKKKKLRSALQIHVSPHEEACMRRALSRSCLLFLWLSRRVIRGDLLHANYAWSKTGIKLCYSKKEKAKLRSARNRNCLAQAPTWRQELREHCATHFVASMQGPYTSVPAPSSTLFAPWMRWLSFHIAASLLATLKWSTKVNLFRLTY